MGETYSELRDQYDAFLRRENESGRSDFVDRITSSVDDYQQMLRDESTRTTASAAAAAAAVGACIRVPIRLAELRGNPALWQALRQDPLRHLRALEGAVKEVANEERPGASQKNEIKVSLTGTVGASASSPRELNSSSLRQLVCVEGVATKVSTIKPKVVKSTHYNPTKDNLTEQKYVDETDPQLGLPELDNQGQELERIINVTKSTYPQQDKEGNLLETEFGLSQYKDHQTITLQEMPEKAPMGQLPRSVELILDHDLVDKIKPGDRVMVVGVYRALPGKAVQGQQTSSGVFRTVVLVNSIQTLGRDASQLNMEPRDITNIRELAKRDDILSVIGRSICPSIHGHEIIKKALALQLLSGVEKNLENGTHLRGDINILMVGDPSTAKSQLLRSAMTIAQLAVSTTGKGSSGVGLTAAVTSDPDTGERRLEAGAMVLADRGLVCVDEFDKMGENDRVAIHEAMEQQTVTIAKAGIHASLNARCSVLAAANPVYGQYDRRRRIQENIGLPDSLLSRFDLLFVVLDQMDPETDRRIASHVIRGHRYHGRNNVGDGDDNDGFADEYGEADEEDEDETFLGADKRGQSIWRRNRHYVPSENDTNEDDDDNGDDDADPHAHDVLQHDFLRKFLYFAKNSRQPVLTESARDFIAHRYAEMRARQDERTLPITARSLETIIRMATAHAKARLSHTVEAEPDCAVAMDILSFALYHEEHRSASNNKTTNTSGSPRRTQDVTPEGPRKRARLTQDEELQQAGSSDKENAGPNQADDMTMRIWNAVNESGGVLTIDELGDPEENPALQQALDALSRDGRVQVSDGMVYLV